MGFHSEKKNDQLACGCERIERASVEEASSWLMEKLRGSRNVEISIVVGGDRCSFWRNKHKRFEVGTFGPPSRTAYKEKE